MDKTIKITFVDKLTHYYAHTTTNTEQNTGRQQQNTTTIVAMHTDRYNRYALLPYPWHGRMDGHRMGTHIRLPIRLTLWRYKRYHYRLLRRSTALHRHHTYLHYHILPAQTQSKQNDTPKERQLA